jgi:hypothetical protein
MKNSNDTIGNRTRKLSARSAVPQPTAPPRAASPSHQVTGSRLSLTPGDREMFIGNYCHQIELSVTDVLFRTLRRNFASLFCCPTVHNDDRCRSTSFCSIVSYCNYTSETLSNL